MKSLVKRVKDLEIRHSGIDAKDFRLIIKYSDRYELNGEKYEKLKNIPNHNSFTLIVKSRKIV